MKESPLNKFIYYFNLLYKKGLSYGLSGNASLREKDKIYITPTGSPKEGIKKNDLVVIDLKKEKILSKSNKKPSVEADFHLWVYKNFKKINSIFHAHTFYANLYFLKKDKVPCDEVLKKENIILLKEKKWKERIKNKINENTKILHIKNHGTFSLGKSPEEAFAILDHFENLCRIEFVKTEGLKIKESQNLIKEIYFERDSKREFTKNVLWFVEEVGEFLQAIRKGDKSKIEEETADTFAWFLTLCNLLNLNLEEIFFKKYTQFCPRCKKKPCECQNI
ncbi:MAG: class II aldolase/adducin family protein [candidate division WOR-3 bacterium]